MTKQLKLIFIVLLIFAKLATADILTLQQHASIQQKIKIAKLAVKMASKCEVNSKYRFLISRSLQGDINYFERVKKKRAQMAVPLTKRLVDEISQSNGLCFREWDAFNRKSQKVLGLKKAHLKQKYLRKKFSRYKGKKLKKKLLKMLYISYSLQDKCEKIVGESISVDKMFHLSIDDADMDLDAEKYRRAIKTYIEVSEGNLQYIQEMYPLCNRQALKVAKRINNLF